MNPAYKDIQHEADHLHHRTESMIDDRSQEMAEEIAEGSRDILECVESGRPPRAIEDTIKRLQQHLHNLKSAPTPVISPNDAGSLLDEYERLRRKVRELPNY